MGQVKAKKVVGQAARLEHLRRKIHKTQREMRGDKQTPAEVIEALHAAKSQLSHAIDILDLLAGQQARDELTGGKG